MSTTADLVSALKHELKTAHMTYADLAAAMGMAESSVKRMLSKGDMPLSRIDAICRALKLDFADLARRVADAQPLLAQLTQERAGLAPLEPNEQTQEFMSQALRALSDAQFYPAALVFELKDFQQVQASVFEVARAPGKNIVYLGCAFLILGIFAMLYIRERRIWVWLSPRESQSGEAGHQSHATMALSSNRKTMDGDAEFAEISEKLIGVRPDGSTA